MSKSIIDSETVLDYALFQLTPTRTRCDLMIFAGKKTEKIASGLLDPFLSHLKSAKDQISKGGYSITLQPLSSHSSSWFTKATLNRFVRFVNTPEILERFVSIDNEIGQIDKEIDSSTGLANGTLGAEIDEATDAEDKPKVRLQRVLKSRKSMLEKELAMAYARALVAGFEMDYLHDLASFSDAFGAQRLREACTNFMEICNRKNDDKIWMDEVAAVQATYIGSADIMPSFESNDLSSNFLVKNSSPESITRQGSLDAAAAAEESASTVEFPQQTGMPTYRGNFSQYSQNSHGPYPVFPQMPPYPGYMFPGFQVPPSHYPSNMAWPGNYHSSGMKPGRESKKKDRNADSVESDSSEEEEDDDQQRLSNPEEKIEKKKTSRRSSRKVVIRNINFIAGGRNDEKDTDSNGYSSTGDEYVNADSIKQHVEAAVGSIKRNHKWKTKKENHKPKNDDSEVEEDEQHPLEEEKTNGNWDVFQNFLMKDSESRSETTVSRNVHVQESLGDDISHKKPGQNYGNEDFLFKERLAGSKTQGTDVRFDNGEVIRTVVKRGTGEDVFIPNRSEVESKIQNVVLGPESTIIRQQKEEDWFTGSKPDWSARQLASVDQSIDEAYGNNIRIGHREKDILDDSFMVQTRASEETKCQPKTDIFMDSDIVGDIVSETSVPQVIQAKVESSKFSEPEDLYMVNRHDFANDQVAASWTPEMDYVNNIPKVEKVDAEKTAKRGVSKYSKSKTPSGYLGRSKSAMPTRSKISPPSSASNRSKNNLEEERRKRMEELLIQRQKRIAERTAASGTTTEHSKTKGTNNTGSSRDVKPKVQAPVSENKALHKNVTRSLTMDRLSTPLITKQPSVESRVRPSPTMLKKTKAINELHDKANFSEKKPKSKDDSNISSKPQEIDHPKNKDIEDVKELHTVTSVEKKEIQEAPISDNNASTIQVFSDDIIPSHDASVHISLQDNTNDLPYPLPPLTVTTGTGMNSDVDDNKAISFSHEEISVADISTPPSPNAALAPSRKKWGDGKTSPKAAKGFRKLLLFGRKN